MNTLPQHHPDKNLLIEFATGAIDHAQAIAVSTHIHYCARCRNDIKELEHIGGAMLLLAQDNASTPHLTDVQTDAQAFERLMKRIDEEASPQYAKTKAVASAPISPQYASLPKPIRKMLADTPIKWKRVTANLRSASLVAGQNKYAVSLQKIQAGGRVPEHDHRGSEITVVLKGSFSDEDSVYHEGDFLLKNIGDKHQPMAASNEDCLCLSVEQAPVKLTSLFGRLANPFIRINAM
jgi:putative transcriptional regulator